MDSIGRPIKPYGKCPRVVDSLLVYAHAMNRETSLECMPEKWVSNFIIVSQNDTANSALTV